MLNPDDIHIIEVTVNPYDATNKKVTFSSSNPEVATVDDKGNVTATGLGTTVITVTSAENPDVKKEITVTVEKPFVDSTGLELNKETVIIRKGETDKVIVTVKPDDATDKSVIYKSSDESVVKVDEEGNIIAVGEGTAVIRVSIKGKPHIYKEVWVEIKPEKVPVTDVTPSENEIELEEGATGKVTVTVTPDNATEKGVTYSSSDESVVKVDEKGNIIAVGAGTATITVKSKDDPTKTATVTVKVKAPAHPGYTIVVPDGININEGETKNLGITITPDDGTIKPVYTSGDESIVTVDADGNITGIKAGITTITVDFGNGDIRVIPVVVVGVVVVPRKHHICFGKTDGIGWYEVSVNGGDFFPQGPNSTLEVDEGSILVVRVQDMWIDDEFDFYVNGTKVPMDPANTITVVVDGYMLIGALSMDAEVPDVEESLSILDKIRIFFTDIINWFKNLFS